MIKKIYIMIFIVAFLLVTMPAKSIGGDPDNWVNPGGPSVPQTGDCNNPTPSDGAENVVITAKGVQTCVDITVDANCTVNVTFQWLNWTQYFDAWLDWAYEQDWFDPDNISWATEPTYENDSFWYDYGQWNNINSSQQLCEYNENVSCYTNNNWATQWFDWRVITNYTCNGNTTESICYSYFTAEECSITYIYPASPNGTLCPCCDSICFTATNQYGNPMNITIYANDTMNQTFYILNKYINIRNGTYCFCTCGHMADIFYPMRYNETYHWYINTIDTVTNVSTNSSIFQFRTATDPVLCPCGLEAMTELIEDTDKIKSDSWLIGLIVVFFGVAIILARKRRF